MEPESRRMVTCSYNPAHQVESSRLQYHLEKCKKQHLNTPKVECPFDSTHIFNEFELDYHVARCPKRAMFDQMKYIVEDGTTRPHVASATISTQMQPPCAGEENWDNECTTTYVPDFSKKGAHIITKIKGATPSERRKARMEGIKNYRPLENKN